MFIERFDYLGIRTSHLADLVARLSLAHAAKITAGGIESQFKYLNTVGNTYFCSILISALQKKLKPGKMVVVNDSQDRSIGSVNWVVGQLEDIDESGQIIRIACKVGGIRQFNIRKIVRVCGGEDDVYNIPTITNSASVYERFILLGLEPSDLHSQVIRTALDKATEFNEFGLQLQVDFLRLVCAMNDVDILLEALFVAKNENVDVEISGDKLIVGRLQDVNVRTKSVLIQFPDSTNVDFSINRFVRIVRD